MIGQKLLQWSIGTGLILPFVVGCSAPAAAPTQPINTSTPIPPTVTPIPTPIPPTVTPIPPTATPTPTPVPEPSETFVVMTYNIECGAGVAPVLYSPNCMLLYDKVQAQGGRIDRVIDFLREVQPDILGIQEALRWADHETGTGRFVAEQLGLNYVLGASPSGDNHVALYTRFEILASEAYGEPFTRALLRSELKLPDESVLNVFVVHLKSSSKSELEALIAILGPYADKPTIVMGDFNLFPDQIDLEQQGFALVARNLVDLIYATQSVGKYAGALRHVIEVNVPNVRPLSDHWPVAAEIAIR